MQQCTSLQLNITTLEIIVLLPLRSKKKRKKEEQFIIWFVAVAVVQEMYTSISSSDPVLPTRVRSTTGNENKAVSGAVGVVF